MRILTAKAEGNGSAFEIKTGGKRDKENIRTVYCWGTFGGATVTLEISLDQVVWFPVTGVSFTEKGVINIEARTRYIRGVVGAGTSESIDMAIH